MPGIGKKIYIKFNQYLETGTVPLLEREKGLPRYDFLQNLWRRTKKGSRISGKKTIFTSIQQLREHQDLLNDKQKIGLRYYEDILKRIPRSEIEEFETSFSNCICEGSDKGRLF